MGFFKDFKEDFNDALDEMAGAEETPNEEVMVNTLDGDIDVESELNKLDGLLEQVTKKVETPVASKPEATAVEPQGEKKSFFETKKETKMEAPRTMDVMGNVAENNAQGEVVTSGTAKVGVGSVIIGNITATSAVIAGAVKGDIDVNGPVVVDTSAVVMGNIKSRSVQINNGAVIEGFCSQSYADVDVNSVFNI